MLFPSKEEQENNDSIMNEKMNPKIVEKWIANTLEDAKYFDIPGKQLLSSAQSL